MFEIGARVNVVHMDDINNLFLKNSRNFNQEKKILCQTVTFLDICSLDLNLEGGGGMPILTL